MTSTGEVVIMRLMNMLSKSPSVVACLSTPNGAYLKSHCICVAMLTPLDDLTQTSR
jgi:hypothetical protein